MSSVQYNSLVNDNLQDLKRCQAKQVGECYALVECLAKNSSCCYVFTFRHLVLCSHPLRCEIVKKTRAAEAGKFVKN